MKYIEEVLTERFGGISQAVLMKRIELYLQQKDRDVKLAEGYCFALALLWGYQTLLGTDKEFFDLVTKIAKWNGVDDYETEFEKLFSRIEWLQRHHHISGIPLNLFDSALAMIDSTGIQKEYTVAFMFKEAEIISTLEQVLKNQDKVLLVGSHNHAVAIINRGGVLKFYDSNNPGRPHEFKTVAELVTNTRHGLLQSFVFENTRLHTARNLVKSVVGSKIWPQDIPLSINVFDLKGNTPGIYPENIIPQILKNRPEKDGGINNTSWDNVTAVWMAAVEGDFTSLKTAVDYGADVNILDAKGYSPLYRSLMPGAKNEIQYLIDHGAKLDMKYKSMDRKYDYDILQVACHLKLHPEDYVPLLVAAIKQGHADMVLNALRKRSLPYSIDAFVVEGSSLLHFAAENNQLDILEELINQYHEKDLDINFKNAQGESLLDIVKRIGDKKLIELVVNYQLEFALSKPDLETIKNLAQNFPQIINDKDFLIKLELDIAIKKNDLSRVTEIIKDNPHVLNLLSPTLHLPPLMTAIHYGHLNVAKFILANGGDANFSLKNYNCLHFAASYADTQLLQELIKKGVNVNQACPEGTPLLMTAQRGHLTNVLTLIEYGADITVTNRDDFNILHIFAMQGNIDGIKLLFSNQKLSREVSDLLKQKNDDGQTPVQLATTGASKEVVDYLLAKTADLTMLDNDNNTLLHSAACTRDVKILQTILQRVLNENATNKHHQTPIELAIDRGFEQNVKYLIENNPTYLSNQKAPSLIKTSLNANQRSITLLFLNKLGDKDINMDDDQGMNLAHWIVESKLPSLEKQELITDFLKFQGNINSSDHKGMTPLHYAVIKNDLQLAQLLIRNGASLSKTNYANKTPIQLAQEGPLKDFLTYQIFSSLLLQGKLSELKSFPGKPQLVNRKDDQGNTLLHLTLENKPPLNIIKFLISTCNAEVNIKNNEGDTPLHFAIKFSSFHIFNTLLSSSANLYVKNLKGEGLLHTAIVEKKIDCVELLLKKQPSLAFIKDDQKRSPLHIAVLAGDAKIVSLLIQQGLNLNASDFRGKTPLQYATENNQKTIINLLLDAGAKLESFENKHRQVFLNLNKDILHTTISTNKKIHDELTNILQKQILQIKNKPITTKLQDCISDLKSVPLDKYTDEFLDSLLNLIQTYESGFKGKLSTESSIQDKNIALNALRECKNTIVDTLIHSENLERKLKT